MEDKYIAVEGKKIHYVTAGAGPAVVLLHGLMEGAWVWREMTEVWAAENRVLAIDLPGHGQSEVLADVHSVPLCAQVVEAVMRAENVAEAVLVGHSMGGYVALAVADLFPEKVKGVVLFHSQAAQDGEEGLKQRQRAIALLEAGGEAKKDFVTRFMPTLFAPQNRERMADKIAALTEAGRAMSLEAILAIQKGLAERKSYLHILTSAPSDGDNVSVSPPTCATLPKGGFTEHCSPSASFPLCFIIGRHDEKQNVSKVMGQAMLCERAEILWLPCGHMGFWEEPEACAAFVRDFVRRVG